MTFVPGVSGNPLGRPRVPAELKDLRRLTRSSLEIIINKYIHLSHEELKDKREDGSLPGIEVAVVSILLIAINKGDQVRLDYLIARLVGKIPEAPPLPPIEKDAAVIDEKLQKAFANIRQMAKDNLDEETSEGKEEQVT